MARLKPVHPGKILRDEFMIRFDWNPNKLALALRVAAPNADEIVREARGISSDMSFRLARYYWHHGGVLDESPGATMILPFPGRKRKTGSTRTWNLS